MTDPARVIDLSAPDLPADGPGIGTVEQPPPPVQSINGLTAPRRRGRRSTSVIDVLVELGYLAAERATEVVEASKANGRRAEALLLEENAVSTDVLARASADRLGLDHVDLTVYEPDIAAVNLISTQAAKRYSAVPIGFHEDGRLLVAMADASNVLTLDDLKLVTGHEIRAVVASPDDVASLIGRMNRLDEAVARAVEDEEEESGELAAVTEIKESAEDAPVIRLVNSILAQAVGDNASDVHFEPDGRNMRVRFRVDGVLSERTTIPKIMVPGVVSRVKIMADLDISERRLSQDGRVGLRVEGRHIDVRVVTMPSVLGEGIVMRILQKESVMLTLDALGIREAQRQRLESGIRQSYGAVLVTGPTGSGKSTTLYAALNSINTPEKSIITIEDPVEYQLPGINQLQVNHRAGLTFASGLRSMLRADPDIIMVGEIRDSETARIAIESALTGHLVLSTLHTNDAASAVTRLTEMEVEPFLTASALDCVVAQRLARALCTNCKRLTMLSAESLQSVGFRATVDVEGYESVGCSRCNFTGYKGRIGLYEVMTLSDEIRRMAIDRAASGEIRDVAVEQGMRLLRDDGFHKVRLGITSVAEIARVT